jgi:ATP-binding cassette subfamily B protein
MWNDLKVFLGIMKIYISNHWSSVIIGFVMATLFSLVSLTTPYMTKYLIDVVFAQNRHDLMFNLILFSGAIIVFIAVFKVVSDYILINLFEKIKISMRKDLFSKMLKNTGAVVTNNTSGEMNYRIFADSEVIESFFNSVLVTFPLNLLYIIILASIMITCDPLDVYFSTLFT